MYSKKKKLIELAFEKAKKELPNGSKTSVASYLSAFFEEKFGFSKDERTFVRFYKALVEENSDYKIDAITLDHLSIYTGYKNFSDFCENIKNEPVIQNFGPVKISISENEEHSHNLSDSLSKIVVNITNAPVFNIPEFISKYKNSLGILGILILGGFFANNQGYFIQKTGNGKIVRNEDTIITNQQSLISSLPPAPNIITGKKNNDQKNNIIQEIKTKQCMYWDTDHYEAVFCNEKTNGNPIVALNEELILLFRKINSPDTLTIENAIGKVWYDKTNKKIEFFTHYGIHPVNGKTLKPISKYILEKYSNN